MPFGATLLASGGVDFRLWAPGVAQVTLEWQPAGAADGWTALPLAAEPGGWFARTVPEAAAGALYRYLLPGGLRVPDPASRRNPQDVHGPSEVVDPLAFEWQHGEWRGRPWEEAVVYELHVGAFTPEGSFDAARGRLPELAALGVTAIELMPLADFPGTRGWGYDGVLPFAPESSYGTPEALKALVDAAHGLGLMVLLDVVYNHFGPEGNYLHAYSPAFFNPAHQTPWGDALNFDAGDAATVRSFFVHNALYWLEEFRFDGLRLDAVHAIRDDSPRHLVAELAEAVQHGPGRERAVHLVLENDLNQARWLARGQDGRPRAATAQWNDDLHHALHVVATGETDGYYADFAGEPLALFGQALAQGFVYDGSRPSAYRGGELRGEPAGGLPHGAFVSYLQTHDQVGNRAFGERIDALGRPEAVRLARAMLLLSPHVPMLFMGEEWAARTPFLFFCDFGPPLAEAVSRGRREEFGRFAAFERPEARARIPDPNAEATFAASRLDWDERGRPGHREALAATRALLALRAREIMPLLPSRPGSGQWKVEGDLLYLQWTLEGGTQAVDLRMVGHFGTAPQHAAAPGGRVIHRQGCERHLAGGLALAPGGLCVALAKAGHA